MYLNKMIFYMFETKWMTIKLPGIHKILFQWVVGGLTIEERRLVHLHCCRGRRSCYDYPFCKNKNNIGINLDCEGGIEKSVKIKYYQLAFQGYETVILGDRLFYSILTQRMGVVFLLINKFRIFISKQTLRISWICWNCSILLWYQFHIQ